MYEGIVIVGLRVGPLTINRDLASRQTVAARRGGGGCSYAVSAIAASAMADDDVTFLMQPMSTDETGHSPCCRR